MRLTGVVSPPPSLTVVVVEDDPSIAGLITKTLEADGHAVVAHTTAADGLAAVREVAPDVLLLDLGLPDQDGSSILRTLRSEEHPVGIICVTARSEEIDRVLGFEMGADDYVTKPFSPASWPAGSGPWAAGSNGRSNREARSSGSATRWWTPPARRCASTAPRWR